MVGWLVGWLLFAVIIIANLQIQLTAIMLATTEKSP